MLIQYLDVFSTLEMACRQLPILIWEGEKAGPTVWLMAGCHGDEVTGIAVIHRCLEFLENEKLLRGKIYAMPLMNSMGVELIVRKSPLDEEDLNRSYPGKPEGEPTERLAHRIYTTIVQTKPNLVIDLHTYTMRSMPFVILDHFCEQAANPLLTEQVEALAQVFGLTVVYDFPLAEYKKQKLDCSLTGALLNQARIPAYTVELGPKRMVVESFAEAGMRGVTNVLRHLQMVPKNGKKAWAHAHRIVTQETLCRDPDVRANTTGFVHFLVREGDEITIGQPLAQIKDIVGKIRETVVAKHHGYVLGLDDLAMVFPGTQLMTLARPG